MRRPSFLILAALAGSVYSQPAEIFIGPTRTFNVPASAKINTTTIVPAIDRTVRLQPRIPKNELVYTWRRADPNNRLRAGGMLTSPRASAVSRLPAIDFTGWVPPDPDFGVGPNWVVCVVNSSIGFYNKSTGANTFLRTFETFFSGLGAGTFLFDPKALFDPISGRFFVLCLEADFSANVSKVLLAVSDDADPNGTWNRYRIEAKLVQGSSEFWLDYPGFGVSRDSVAFCGNMFGFSSGWAGNQFVVLPKAPMLSGASVTATSIHDPTSASVKIATHTTGSDLFALSVLGGDTLRVQAVNPSGIRAISLRVPPMLSPGGLVPGPGGHDLDGLDGRLYNLEFRNNSLVSTHAVWLPGGDNRFVSRWYDIALNGWPASGAPSLSQSGNVMGGPGEHFHMPAVAKNRRNEIAMVFSRTNSTQQADLMITGRKATDRPGTMGRPTLLASTPGNYGNRGFNRWGDYFGMVVDPSDNVTFWGYGMVGRPDGAWTTSFFSLRLNSYAEDAVRVNAALIATLSNQGILQSGTASSVNQTDGSVVRVASKSFQTQGQVASLRAEYQTALNPNTVGYLRLDLRGTMPSAGSWLLYLYNYRTARFDLIQTAAGSAATALIERTEDAARDYISPTGRVQTLVRAVRPLRNGSSAPFNMVLDQFSLSASVRL
jgi:hypothetical protein